MKSRKNLCALALLAVSAFASNAFAIEGRRVELHVPFSFVVAGRTLPPGAYSVAENGTLLYIRGNRGELIVSSLPSPHSTGTKPGLVFRRDNGMAYLVGVQMLDESRVVPFHMEETALHTH